MPRTTIITACLGLLYADLKRQFVLQGLTDKRVRFYHLFFKCLHPRFLPLILCRLSRTSFVMGIPGLPFVFSYLNLVLFGLQITPRCDIGGGLFLPHPSGIVVGSWRIGCNVTLFQQVTLGAQQVDMNFTQKLLPEICDNVTIGAGAKILGGIRLEEGVIVGANAVVLTSVEANSTVVGIPARKITRATS